MAGIARALGLGEAEPAPKAIAELADAIEMFYSKLGLETRLRDYGIAREMLPRILEFSKRNYNADRERHFLKETETLANTLELAW
jgi:alcohol dehydrogenase class IV